MIDGRVIALVPARLVGKRVDRYAPLYMRRFDRGHDHAIPSLPAQRGLVIDVGVVGRTQVRVGPLSETGKLDLTGGAGQLSGD